MVFLALILALLLAFVWDYGPALHRDGWFRRWQAQLGRLGPGPRVWLAVLLPCLLVQLGLNALAPLLFGLVWIIAAAGLLLYALGRGNTGAELEKYRSQCRREDFEAAYLYGAEELHWFTRAEAGEMPSPLQVHRVMQRAYLYQAHQRTFAVLFYFVLLGPVGGLAYRLLQLASGNPESRLLAVADWVPARLLAATFTLTGNFVDSADELLAGFASARMKAPELLYAVAMDATGESRVAVPETGLGAYASRQNEVFAALVRRSSVAWVVVVSLGVLLV